MPSIPPKSPEPPVDVKSVSLPLPIATLLTLVLLLTFLPMLNCGLKMLYEKMLICIVLLLATAPPIAIRVFKIWLMMSVPLPIAKLPIVELVLTLPPAPTCGLKMLPSRMLI